MTDDCIWDVAVVGAGAAGLMTAIVSARRGAKVLLLDGQEKMGAKIIMSGGTRCNLTNQEVSERDFQSEKRHTVKNILSSFSSKKAVEFFKDLGVGVVLEAGGKYFPSTHSGRTVLEALLKEVEKQNINLQKGKKVTSVTFDQNYFILKGDHFSHRAKTVVLCTGGLSYPRTGSDGRGYSVAQALGHTLVPTIPALTPLETSDPVWKSLSGLTIPVSLSLWVNHKKQVSYEGSFLFTHFGFSGPAVLNISRHWIRVRELENVKLTAHFLPIFKEEDWRHLLIESARVHPTRSIKKELALKMPDRFIEVLCQKSEVNSAGLLGQLKKEDRERLIRAICASDLSITQALGYHKAEVTAGGVNLEEVDPHTLESKKQPGLFFAGEILDVDGRIGGFNFQWAWASGQVAGLAAARKFRT